MLRYEYKRISFRKNDIATIEELNALGDDGWMMVDRRVAEKINGTSNYQEFLIFMREKPEVIHTPTIEI